MKFIRFKKGKGLSAAIQHRGLWYRIMHDPYVGWAAIVVCACALGVLAIALGVTTYLGLDARMASSGLTLPPPVSSAANQEADHLKAVLKAFDARAAERAQLSNGYSGPSDPSL